MENLKISVGCKNSSFHFREFCYNGSILKINRRIHEKNLVEILGPMVEKCDILGCFHMERPNIEFSAKSSPSIKSEKTLAKLVIF
jgi:hypothetical protein